MPTSNQNKPPNVSEYIFTIQTRGMTEEQAEDFRQLIIASLQHGVLSGQVEMEGEFFISAVAPIQ